VNVATATGNVATSQASSEAVNLIGHSVTYTDSSGAVQTGTVSSVQFDSAGPTLTIGTTKGISLGSVTGAS
jgi:hypothetical protein